MMVVFDVKLFLPVQIVIDRFKRVFSCASLSLDKFKF